MHLFQFSILEIAKNIICIGCCLRAWLKHPHDRKNMGSNWSTQGLRVSWFWSLWCGANGDFVYDLYSFEIVSLIFDMMKARKYERTFFYFTWPSKRILSHKYSLKYKSVANTCSSNNINNHYSNKVLEACWGRLCKPTWVTYNKKKKKKRKTIIYTGDL